MRGSRVQAVVQELQGEKIDIIPWSPQAATFVVNALAPAEVTKVVMDEEAGRVEVVVPDEQLSLAIGRRGQNVRLASQLTRWDIDILTEAEESERRQEEFRRRSGLFVEALDVDDVIAGLLVTEGFTSVEELAFTPEEEVAAIEGFDEAIAAELIRRAEAFIARRDTELTEKRVELGVTRRGRGDRGADAGDAGGARREGREDAGRSGRPGLGRADRDRRRRGDGRGHRQRRDHGGARALVRRRSGSESGTARQHRRRRSTTEAAEPALEDEPETGPLRRCVVTRERLPKERMIRFVVGAGPDAGAGPDRNPARPGNLVERVSGMC